MLRRLLQGLFRSPAPGSELEPPTTDPRGRGPRRVPSREWAGLPPLRPGLQQPLQQASGVGRFSASLVERHRGVRYLAPLGHEVEARAPRGVVTGLARSVRIEPDRAPLVELPLVEPATRRRRRTGRHTLQWPVGEDAARVEATATAASATSSSVPADAPPDVSSARAPASPSPAVARSGEATSSPAGVDPDVPIERTPAARDPGATAEVPAPPPSADPASDPPPASGTPSTTPSRPLVHHPLRVLRSTTPARPTKPPRATPPRPRGLPLRPLAAHGGDGTPPSIAPSRPVGESPHRPGATPSSEHVPDHSAPDVPSSAPGGDTTPQEPAPDGVTTPDPTPVDETPSRSDPSEVDPQVRPTIGASDASSGSPGVQRAGGRGDWSARLGVGSPMSSLPPTARRLHGDGQRPGPSVTGRGRYEAIARGLERLSSPAKPVRHEAPDAGPSLTTPARTRPAPGSAPRRGHRVDPAAAPVVARQVASALVSPVPRLQPSRDVLPLAGGREPLVAPPSSDERVVDDTVVGAGTEPPVPAVPVRWASPEIAGPTRVDPPLVQRSSATASRPEPTEGRAPAPPVESPDRPDRATDGTGSDAPLGDLPPVFSDHPLVERLRVSRATMSPPSPSAPGPTEFSVRSLPLASPPVQRRPADPMSEETSPPRPAEGPPRPAVAPVQRAETTDPTTTRADPVPAPEAPDMGELFDQLYPRVRDELRWELRAQRERAGLLSDPL